MMTKTNYSAEIRKAVARMGAASRLTHYGKPIAGQAERLREARADLLALRLEAAVANALDPEAPDEPLAMSDRIRLAQMLLDGSGVL